MTTSSRRSFISNLATVATAAAVAPLANALPSEAVAPKRAGVPLRWEVRGPHTHAFFGPVRVGSYIPHKDGVCDWHLGWQWPEVRAANESAARAAIEAEWDKLCNAEPVAAQPAPKVKALEWKKWEVGIGIIALPAPQQYLIIHGEEGEYHITGSITSGYLPVCDTLESAKAAAQAHWNSVVLRALETV